MRQASASWRSWPSRQRRDHGRSISKRGLDPDVLERVCRLAYMLKRSTQNFRKNTIVVVSVELFGPRLRVSSESII